MQRNFDVSVHACVRREEAELLMEHYLANLIQAIALVEELRYGSRQDLEYWARLLRRAQARFVGTMYMLSERVLRIGDAAMVNEIDGLIVIAGKTDIGTDNQQRALARLYQRICAPYKIRNRMQLAA